jgi:hypothetical protein
VYSTITARRIIAIAAIAPMNHAQGNSPEIQIIHTPLHVAHVDVEGEQIDLR